MPNYMVDVRLTVKVAVSAPSSSKAEAMALRQLTVKLSKAATDTAAAVTYKQEK